jgi:hypothetical protein
MATISAVLLCVVGMTVAGIIATVKTGQPPWLFLSLPFTLVTFVAARYAPLAYRLAPDGVHVERKAGDHVVPYRAILSVDVAPRPLRGVSLMASKGLFGRFGRFWNSTLGVYRLFLTNTDAVVWLETDAGMIALSPDRPDEFVERLQAKIALIR